MVEFFKRQNEEVPCRVKTDTEGRLIDGNTTRVATRSLSVEGNTTCPTCLHGAELMLTE